MFEDMTYEKLLQTCLDRAPSGVDTRQGSIFYDACAAKCLVLAETYVSLDIVHEMCHIDSAVGADLDACGQDHGIYRQDAVTMKCRGVFVGAEPSIGSRFFYDGVFFVLRDNLNEIYPNDEELLAEGNIYLEAEVAGLGANIAETGDTLVPYNEIEGLTSAKIGKIIVSGSDEEEDESYRERIKNKISGPAENGNRFHYKTWCEECTGVGCSRIFTLSKIIDDQIVSDIPNWIAGVLLRDDGRAVEDATVALVQEYIDPDMEGLGEGVANAGAHFMAVKAKELYLDVKVAVELSDSLYTLGDAKNEITELVTQYLKGVALADLTFVGVVANDIAIRIKQIGSLISNSDTIVDYGDLKIRIDNGEYQNKNISIAPNCIAVLRNVTVTALEADDTE